jgi:hypothetical protein
MPKDCEDHLFNLLATQMGKQSRKGQWHCTPKRPTPSPPHKGEHPYHMAAAPSSSWRPVLRVSPHGQVYAPEYYTLTPPSHKWGLYPFTSQCLSACISRYPEQTDSQLSPQHLLASLQPGLPPQCSPGPRGDGPAPPSHKLQTQGTWQTTQPPWLSPAPTTTKKYKTHSSFQFFFPIFLAVLGFEFKNSCLLGRHSTTWAVPPTHQVFFLIGIY